MFPSSPPARAADLAGARNHRVRKVQAGVVAAAERFVRLVAALGGFCALLGAWLPRCASSLGIPRWGLRRGQRS